MFAINIELTCHIGRLTLQRVGFSDLQKLNGLVGLGGGSMQQPDHGQIARRLHHIQGAVGVGIYGTCVCYIAIQDVNQIGKALLQIRIASRTKS